MDNYLDVIKKVPAEHLRAWLARHDELEGTQKHSDYQKELELRLANKSG